MDGQPQQGTDPIDLKVPTIHVEPLLQHGRAIGARDPTRTFLTFCLRQEHHVDDDLKRGGAVAVVLLHHLHVPKSSVPGDCVLFQAIAFHPAMGSDEGIVIVQFEAFDMAAVENLSNERTDTVYRCR